MKITYKDVGQGDSIILEWENEGKKIGIIDCNLKGRRNPVLEHIIHEKYTEIEFVILSHPHRDHYSGLLQLLTYIEKNGIIIKRFGHTIHWASQNFWKYFEVNSLDSRRLNKIISKWKKLKETRIIRRMDGLEDDKVIILAKDIFLRCLAPSHDDAENYQKIVDNNADTHIKEASQAANHLSTVFLLSVNDCCVLLTSDAEISSLGNIIEREKIVLDRTVFHVCQLPHHGSKNNYSPEFWKLIQVHKIKYAIISAGKHRTYNHPSFDVIMEFEKNGYDIHCTNILNGMKEYTDYLESLMLASLELDACSTLAEEYQKSNDRAFLLDGEGFKLV